MKIESIEEFSREKFESKWGTYEGYRIRTSKGSIEIGVSDQSCCCEGWGYVSSEDDLKKFIGATVLNVKVTDKALNTKMMEGTYLDEGGIMFLTLETDRGPLQFAVYNGHSGHYGHHAVIRSMGKVLQEDNL